MSDFNRFVFSEFLMKFLPSLLILSSDDFCWTIFIFSQTDADILQLYHAATGLALCSALLWLEDLIEEESQDNYSYNKLTVETHSF